MADGKSNEFNLIPSPGGDHSATEEFRLRAVERLSMQRLMSVKAILDLAIDEIIGLTRSQYGYIYHYSEEKEEFVLHAWSKSVLPACSISDAPTVYKLERTGIWGEAVRQRRAIVLNDFGSGHPLKRGYPDGHAKLTRFMTIPVFANGKIVAVAGVANKVDPYTDDDVVQLQQFMIIVWNMTVLRMKEEELKESEFFFRESQRAAKIGSYSCDFVTSTWRSSEVLDQIFGIGSEYSRTISGWQNMIHPLDQKRMMDHLVDHVIGKGNPFDAEYRIIRPSDGSVRWVRGLGEVSKDSSGAVVSMIGTILDVTERRTIGEQLRQTEKLTAIGQLAGGVAHDFNNQLAVIVSQAEAMKILGCTADQEKRLGHILSAAKRASVLTRHLLTFAQKMPERFEPIDPNLVIRDIAEIVSRSMDRRIQIEVHALAQRVVTGDPSLLENAILNLALNARDAMPAGGLLELTARDTVLSDEGKTLRGLSGPSGLWVEIVVSDTGTGIDPEVLPRVFDPFFTTKNPGKGTGLGLASVQGTIAQMGGAVTVESELGRGTSFTIVLPCAVAGSAVPAPAKTPAHPEKSLEILLVDDDELVLSSTRDLLVAKGHRVLTAETGASAVRLVQNRQGKPLDLILLDFNLPGKNGEGVLTDIRAFNQSVPVIFLTGNVGDVPSNLQTMPHSRIAAILLKPLTLTEVEKFSQYLDSIQ